MNEVINLRIHVNIKFLKYQLHFQLNFYLYSWVNAHVAYKVPFLLRSNSHDARER